MVRKVVGEPKLRVVYNLSPDPYESRVIEMSPDERTKSLTDNLVETDWVDLDGFLAAEDKIDWFLIGAEGFETNVLKGARSLIKNLSPRIIESYPENFEEVHKFLTEEGYSITELYNIYYYSFKTCQSNHEISFRLSSLLQIYVPCC